MASNFVVDKRLDSIKFWWLIDLLKTNIIIVNDIKLDLYKSECERYIHEVGLI
ncbi:hypothetical protein R9X47_18195 [Wukongibacter baidiensis]|uniref:hypothetical protein n=1 Tax=Wukongibacter baidiensis TaxID=1723361 RepID=UPI003D7F4D89